ncbi:MAG: hypothetical protein EOO38_16350 [Cytophagaceae bacterium]|nr:MAG: hypothetical protein EOO38_16350 [Cytophagaceae bacterium]
MDISQFSASLGHIDNQELARLTGLWRAQASSGHAEARSIAHCFAAEQQRRSSMEFKETNRTEKMQKISNWWKFW